MQIRPANPSDLAAVEAIVRSAYSKYVERIGREPAPMTEDYAATIEAQRLTVACLDGKLVGLLEAEAQPDHLLIVNVAVDPSAQGRGVGSALLDQAAKQARELGLNELRLYTNARMHENLTYYPRHGFVETGRRTEDGFDRVFFTRTL